MRPPPHVIVIAVLAVAQGILGVLRALQWVGFGSDLVGRGLLVLPIIGVMAMARGALVGGIALLYIVFAAGVLTSRRWAPGVGFAAVLLNGFALLNVLIAGEPVAQALPWVVVPVIVAIYLLAPVQHRTLGR